jgi:hypothetical protein
MKSFLDTGFLLTLLFKTGGSAKAWEIARRVEGPLGITALQIFSAENRILREIEGVESSANQRAMAANALQNFRWYLEQEVFSLIRLDYDIAIDLASQWQKRSNEVLPALLLMWPAMAVTAGASTFLSFDPRARQLAQASGLKLLPEKL